MEMTGEVVDGWGIIGHEGVVELLRNFLGKGSVPHALLLTGPRGMGKSTIAEKWAAAVNCLADDPTARPCGRCRSCALHASGRHPDLLHLRPVKGAWRIDQVRDLERNLMLSPVEGRYRVAILEDFDLATPAAANALLKTLEEPAPHALIVLTATEESNLLPTIISRCQVLRLRPVPEETLVRGLVFHGIDEGRARLYARISGGRPGLALRMHEDPELLARRGAFWRDLLEALRSNYADRMLYAGRLAENPTALSEWFDYWIGWWRDVTLIQEGAPQSVVSMDLEADLEDIARKIPDGEAVDYLKRLWRGFSMWNSNVNLKLLLEDLLLQMPVVSV